MNTLATAEPLIVAMISATVMASGRRDALVVRHRNNHADIKQRNERTCGRSF
jgi:hypothetical protein